MLYSSHYLQNDSQHHLEMHLLKNIQNSPYQDHPQITLQMKWISTPLGRMIALADCHELYLLEFITRKNLLEEILKLQARTKAHIVLETNQLLDLVEQQLALYFEKKLSLFTIPLHLEGTPFQKKVWESLTKIPYGITRSYQELAMSVHNPQGTRAVAHANSKNHIAIMIPCHRVIYKDRSLGGYAGGILLKEWLLKHESC
ncbi:MAG: methylated-DNA--[protein]-cysteine S-methyltransferase [Candidatus Rhabdochlamydia sp.]